MSINKDVHRIELDTIGRIASVLRKNKISKELLADIEKMNQEFFKDITSRIESEISKR